MAAERTQRLARLARVRDVERTVAASALAQAGAMQARLTAVAARANRMIQECAPATGAPDAAALHMLFAFRGELDSLAAATMAQAERAAGQTLAARQALAAAERRRDLARDRLTDARRTCAMARESRAQLARNVKGRR